MRVDLFDYELPPERIAQHALEPRDSSRLLILDRQTGKLEHRVFRDIVDYLHAGDLLIVNDTRVLPARLYGTRTKTGGKWEGLFLQSTADGWEMMAQTRGKPEIGETITIEGADWHLTLLERTPNKTWIVRPSKEGSPEELLSPVGHTPLPPYIRGGHDEANDQSRYQTVFADKPGAVAAPTAGLHFTPELLESLQRKGVMLEKVTLHVGPGTFLPMTVEETDEHVMHFEWCQLTPAVARRIRDVKNSGGRVVAVGTTAVRTLETAALQGHQEHGFSGSTNLFIVPPFEFKMVDCLITNFHLPKSTLLMLVSALAGREAILAAYREAIEKEYRFYSYGDAMLIL